MISTITLDTYKQQIGSGDAFNLSDSFNGRVGDEQVPLVVQFKERGLAQQFQDGLVPFLTGFVGSLDENNQVTAETGEAVSYVGTSSDIVGLGRVKMNLPGTMFPQEGYFYGFLGLQNDAGKRVTTFNVWFHVYNGNPDMFVNKAPFRTELQNLLDAVKLLINDADGDLNKWKQKLTDLFTTLSAQGTDTATLLTTLEAKIKQDGLFTQAEADAFKQTMQDVVTGRLAEFQTTYQDDVAKMDAQIETLNQNGYRVLPYKMISGTTDPVGVNGTISENQIEHLATIGASLALVDMVNIQSATDANPTKSDGHEMQRVIDLCKKHSVPIQMLKPHLGINWSDNFYRANYNPTDVISAMKNWGSILMSYADICNSNNIPILCIECEHYILTQNKYLDYWTDIINQIRQKYQNLKLTAAYMSFEIVDPEHKDLLQKLDIIGLNVYPGYIIDSYDESFPVSYLVQAFYNTVAGDNIAADIDQVCDELQKPALITETGCIPTMGGLTALTPSDYDSSKGANDYEVTAYLMKALFRFMQEDRNIIGFAWWHLNKPFSFFDDSNSTDNLSIAEQALKSYIERKLI